MDELPDRAAADLALLTSEVVANAVQHGSKTSGDEITVRVETNDILRVEVDDCGRVFEPPERRKPWEARTNGWGLYLVDTVARRWGIDSDGRGKQVWFELDVTSD